MKSSMHKTKVASNKSTINHALHIHHISTKVTKANVQAQAEFLARDQLGPYDLDFSTSKNSEGGRQRRSGITSIGSRASSVRPPAKKKKHREYATELKKKTHEEPIQYFEGFTGHNSSGYFCRFVQCNPATRMKM